MPNSALPWYLIVFFFLLGGVLCVGRTDAGEVAFFAAGLIVTCIVSAVAVKDAQANLFEQKAKYAQWLVSCDPQRLDMIDINWPRLHLRMNGGASLTVDDSGVELRYFRQFLNASNAVYIVAQRTYGDKTIERAQWRLWQKYLLLEGAIVEVRAQNETWKWSNPEEWQRYKLMYCDLRPPVDLLQTQADAPAGTQPIPVNDELTMQFR